MQDVFSFSARQLWGPSKARSEPLRNKEGNHKLVWVCSCGRFGAACPKSCIGVAKQQPLTARLACQTLGSNWARGLDKDVWARLGVKRAQMVLEDNSTNRVRYGERIMMPQGRVVGVCLADFRFPNEARHIKQAGGVLWKVERPGVSKDIGGVASHESERHIDDLPCDYIIDNSGPLEALQGIVEHALAIAHANTSFPSGYFVRDWDADGT